MQLNLKFTSPVRAGKCALLPGYTRNLSYPKRIMNKTCCVEATANPLTACRVERCLEMRLRWCRRAAR